jgi:hypothetical protein
MGLSFDYCECGCKGYEASAGSEHFWIFWDLKSTFTLNKGHGWTGTLLGKFATMKEAEAKANEVAFAKLEEMKKALGA